jgi:hypothetical protein
MLDSDVVWWLVCIGDHIIPSWVKGGFPCLTLSLFLCRLSIRPRIREQVFFGLLEFSRMIQGYLGYSKHLLFAPCLQCIRFIFIAKNMCLCIYFRVTLFIASFAKINQFHSFELHFWPTNWLRIDFQRLISLDSTFSKMISWICRKKIDRSFI